MILVMLVSLYTSRVVLAQLGVTDYGIYNVVGGIVVFISFINSSMANAVQRFLSFELGRNNISNTSRILSVSILVHILISIIFALISELAGPWFIDQHLNIPSSSIFQANIVFQCTIISTIVSFIQVPLNALIISKEKMSFYSVLGIVEVVLKLLTAYTLIFFNRDKLILFAFLQVAISITVFIIYLLYTRFKFVEFKFKIIYDKTLFKSILGFAGWNTLGELSWAVSGSGVNIILNIFCGTTINASKAIADQVNGAVMKFVANFQTAMNPQIIKSYAANDYTGLFSLLDTGCRLSYYLLFMISLPLILEMDTILHIWLVEVPKFTIQFCQWVLICSLVSTITNLFAQAIRATGHIRNYQVTSAVIQILNFPFSYIFLKIGFNPTSVLVVATIIQMIIGLIRMWFVRKQVGYPLKDFMTDILYPIFRVTLLSMMIPLLLHSVLKVGLFKLMIVVIASLLSVSLSAFWGGMSNSERSRVIGFLKRLKRV